VAKPLVGVFYVSGVVQGYLLQVMHGWRLISQMFIWSRGHELMAWGQGLSLK